MVNRIGLAGLAALASRSADTTSGASTSIDGLDPEVTSPATQSHSRALETSHHTRQHAAISSASTWDSDMTHLHEGDRPSLGRHAHRPRVTGGPRRYTLWRLRPPQWRWRPARTTPSRSSPRPPPFQTHADGGPAGHSGLFSYTRNDQSAIVLENSLFAREAANFTNTDPRYIDLRPWH